MRKNIFALPAFVAVAIVIAFTSCAGDENLHLMEPSVPQELVVDVALPGQPATRARLNTNSDHWTYDGFEVGDQLGLFSQAGNFREDDGKGPIDNALLTCESTGTNGYYRFRGNDIQISQQYIRSNTVFFYFPFDQNITIPGMELRKSETDSQGETTLRCVDFLTGNGLDVSDLAQGSLSGTFEHTFSELIIIRGEGFDHPREGEEDIFVVMKKPYTHITATPESESGAWKVKLQLTNIDGSETAQGKDARAWQAWAGEDYAETGWVSGKPAWYVVLPTLPDQPTEIDYIEIYDNEGVLQRVTAMSLMNGSRYVESGWRYPIEIAMKELVPTAFPFGILAWSSNVDLTYERPAGISSITEFKEWKTAYEQYVNTNANVDNTLLKYGDKVVDSDGNFLYWHFFVSADLNFNGQFTSGLPIIPKLQDVLDGISSTFTADGYAFTNHRISNLPGPLTGEITGRGGVQNFNIVTTSFETKETAAGIIADKMTGGHIDNCTVSNGSIVSTGQVGMAVGQAEGGKITNSNFSGLLLGGSSYEGTRYITGNNPTAMELTDNFSTVIFSTQ